MKYLIPYLLVFLTVFSVDFLHSQEYSEIDYTEIDSLISSRSFNKAEFKIRHSIEYKKELEIDNFGDELFKLSSLNKQKKIFGLALQQVDSALVFFENENNEIKIANSYLLKGALLNRLGDYIDAITYLKKAELTFKLQNDIFSLGRVKITMGNIHSNMFNVNEAANYYHESIVCFDSVNDKSYRAKCNNNLGILYQEANELDSARLYYSKALEYFKIENNPNLLFVFYHNYANLFLIKKEYQSALKYMNSSIQVAQKIKNYVNYQTSYLVFGEIYYGLKEYETAIDYLKKGLENTDDMFSDHSNDSHVLIARCYSEINAYKKATDHFNKYLIINDSIHKRKNSSSIEKQFVNYEILTDSLHKSKLTIHKELSEVEKDYLLLESKLTKNKTSFLFIAFILSLGFGLLLLFSFKKRLKLSNAHKEILEDQNEELKRTLISKEEKETMLKEIHHRVKNNLQIINSLIRLQSHYMSPTNYMVRIADTENRIRSMALVHEKLYTSQNLSKLDSESYIIDLVDNLKSAYDLEEDVRLQFCVKKIQLSIDTLIPLGLIVNEVISNSLKYAFTGLDGGEIKITLEQEDRVTLTISDNGIGADLTYEELSEDSLGMELIDSLCAQLNGEFNLNTRKGFSYTFIFDKFE